MAQRNDNGCLTLLLDRAREGDAAAKSEFCDLVYDELKTIARSLIRRPADSVQSTQLVNELLLAFFVNDTFEKSVNRKYFFSVAIDQMRRILIDHHRKRTSLKRGGHFTAVPIDQALDNLLDSFEKEQRFDVEAIENALEELKQDSERQYEVVKFRFYGGLSVSETAEILGISIGSVERDWRLARAKLFAKLRPYTDGTVDRS